MAIIFFSFKSINYITIGKKGIIHSKGVFSTGLGTGPQRNFSMSVFSVETWFKITRQPQAKLLISKVVSW